MSAAAEVIEKLEEELVDASEDVGSTRHELIRVIQRKRTALPAGWLQALETALRRGDVVAALECLRNVVPAYQPSELVAVAGAERLPATEPVVGHTLSGGPTAA